jgi:hypothetical protein
MNISGSSETLVAFYHPTRSHILANSNLHTYSLENLTSLILYLHLAGKEKKNDVIFENK